MLELEQQQRWVLFVRMLPTHRFRRLVDMLIRLRQQGEDV